MTFFPVYKKLIMPCVILCGVRFLDEQSIDLISVNFEQDKCLVKIFASGGLHVKDSTGNEVRFQKGYHTFQIVAGTLQQQNCETDRDNKSIKFFACSLTLLAIFFGYNHFLN